MDYAQDRIATLHDLRGWVPPAPVDRAAVVVPMADDDPASLAAERTLAALERVGPGRVVVPLRSTRGRVPAVREWLDGFDLPIDLLWCGGDRLTTLLADHGLDGASGKGRDVWLALGVAAEGSDYIVCHDADRETYSTADVPRLLAPLADGFEFTKGFYARMEDGRLYGRLWRLCYVPLVRALAGRHAAPVVDYLEAFRYALAGEFGLTTDLARRLSVERRFGLEVGSLGEAFSHAGFDRTAQVDLGLYEHEHRAVSGPAGLAEMAADVAAALFRVVEDHGVVPDYPTLPDRFLAEAERLLDQYAADAAFNGLTYDRVDERTQIDRYVTAVEPPGPDDRLPPWTDAPITPDEVRETTAADLARH